MPRIGFTHSIFACIRRLQADWWLWPLALTFATGMVNLFFGFAMSLTARRDLTVPEGSIVYSILAVAGEGQVYRDCALPPYATTPYPPVFYLFSGGFTWLAGGGVEVAYSSGRLVCFLATCVMLWLVARLARHAGASTTWSIGAALAAATVWTLTPFAYTCRPDILAIAFTLAGLDWFLTHPDPKGAAVTAVLFLVGIFTKHVVISAWLALCLYLLWSRQWKSLAVLVGGLVAGALLVLQGCEWATGGLFGMNVIDANIAPLKGSQPLLFMIFGYLLAGEVPVFYGVVVPLLIWWARGKERRLRPTAGFTLLTLYAVVSLGVAVLLSAKAGAGGYYFMEPAIAAAILSGRGLGSYAAVTRRKPGWRLAGVITSLVLAVQTIRVAASEPHFHSGINGDTDQVLTELAAIPGDILFGDAGLAMRSGRPVLLLDKFNASYLSDAGLIDCGALTHRLEQLEISAVVIERPTDAHTRGQFWWPRPVAAAIDKHYVYKRKCGDQMILLPRRQDDRQRSSQ